jgi:hypothetical protein
MSEGRGSNLRNSVLSLPKTLQKESVHDMQLLSRCLIRIVISTIILNNRLYGGACIESVQVPLPNSCSRTVNLDELMRGPIPVGAYLKINDSNPSNGEIVDGLSPSSGWKYGVFSSTGNLICSGVLNTVDYVPPNWTEMDSLSWLNFDTLVLWNHDRFNIEQVAATWMDASDFYFTGAPIMEADGCGGLQSINVTDRLDFNPCESFEVKLLRTFVFADSRNNKRSITQVIYFRKPELNVDCGYIIPPNTFSDFGPSNLTMFGVIGSYLGVGTCGVPDTISYSECGNYSEADLLSFAKDHYLADYLLPNGNASQVNLLDLQQDFSYAFSLKTFQGCPGSSYSEIVLNIIDRCSAAILRDTLYLTYKDSAPPSVSPLDGSLPILGHSKPTIDTEYMALPVLPFDSLSHGCSGELYLPDGSDDKLLGTLFNWTINDDCSARSELQFQFKVQTAWKFNDPYFKTYPDFTDAHYPISPLPSGGEMIHKIPVGYHRLVISAMDGCLNKLQDTLYFLVYDKVKPRVITKDQLHISLPITQWNSSGDNQYKDENGEARIYVPDINEGTYDECLLDSLYIRRNLSREYIQKYLLKNMDYDLHSHSGISNGVVDFDDFEMAADQSFFTPRGMPYVSFHCDDVGKEVDAEIWAADFIQILDLTGTKRINLKPNWDWNQTKITVEDNSSPQIKAPSVPSTEHPNWINYIDGTDKEGIKKLEDPIASNAIFGFPEVSSGSCQPLVIYQVEKNLSCDTGYIDRIWTLIQVRKTGDTLRHTARQRITIRAKHSFSFTVPKDETTTCLAKLQPKSEFTWEEHGCDLIAVSYRDQSYYSDITSENCFKIFRTATFINWCMLPNQFQCGQADPMEYARILPRSEGKEQTFRFEKIPAPQQLYTDTLRNLDHIPLSTFSPVKTASCAGEQTFAWQYTQIISVKDQIPPVIHQREQKEFYLRTADCKARVSFFLIYKDDCSNANFKGKKVQIRNRTSGNLVKEYEAFPGKFNSDTCHVSLGDFSEGQYIANLTITDACGNAASDTISFSVRDQSIIPIICVQQLTTTLTLSNSDIPSATIHFSDFLQDKDGNPSDCSGTTHYYLLRDTFPNSYKPEYPSEESKYLTLNCDDLREPLTALRLYQVDSKGNSTYCRVYVKLEDKYSLCNRAQVNISGKISLRPGLKLNGFRVTLTGSQEFITITNEEGVFTFDGLKANAPYTLSISKESGFLEGVSTYDLLLINRHILGIRPFKSPYSFAAADVNNSGSVTTLDMVILRKMILLVEKSFPNNANWRFFDKSGQEKIKISTLTNQYIGEIIGVKTGDVSGAEEIR